MKGYRQELNSGNALRLAISCGGGSQGGVGPLNSYDENQVETFFRCINAKITILEWPHIYKKHTYKLEGVTLRNTPGKNSENFLQATHTPSQSLTAGSPSETFSP